MMNEVPNSPILSNQTRIPCIITRDRSSGKHACTQTTPAFQVRNRSSFGSARRVDAPLPRRLALNLEIAEAFIELGELAATVHEPVNTRPCRMGARVDVEL